MPTLPLTAAVGLNAVNNPNDVRTVKRRLVELGFNWLQADSALGPETIKTIQLFQAIKNGLNVVGDPRNDGRINPGGDTHLWLQANNAPRWLVMPPGSKAEGFINDELADTSDQHDFGASWLAEVLRAIALDFKNTYLRVHPNASVIRLNDISLPRGGPTPSHASHQAGMCCDLKLPKLNGQAGGITYNDLSYDQLTARAMLETIKRHPQASRTFFNDPVLIAEGLCQAVTGHDNHIHFEIKPPVRR
ncbi:MAG: penicillin-insensitive murein endopeptidase [Acidobacteria bacterium]|nr:penicillin-insensitive murein endopeptidase [Acidobacteriota bacterium]MBI3427166.1 penicillin-insensitive murein endopeptidase [Acidobacteriota bacterium]